ncbi:type II secretion system F family protein [Candidatus Gromoviella agglomerans]|uniref:type II secretion system F family protein n=1 Tax=Candidatus Gromoviella agglomerans TaxID=2806609 RepID=UPI001E487843|nr:type II secretion system F family protein [Candidatus Gromoviella agglomerans]
MFIIIPYFKYKIVQNGNIICGRLNVISKTDAIKQISSGDLVSLKKRYNISRRVELSELRLFFYILNKYLDSGLTLVDSLEEVKAHSSSRMKMIIDALNFDIHSGSMFGCSISKHSDTFDTVILNLIIVGEEIGNLSSICVEIVHYLDRVIEVKGKLNKSLRYPIIAFMVMLFCTYLFNKFLISPMMLFMIDMHLEIPYITIYIMNTVFNIDLWIYLLVSIIVIFIVMKKFVKHYSYFDITVQKISLKIPWIGNFISTMNIFYFSNSMALLLKNSVFLINAIDIAKNSVKNRFISSVISKMECEIKNGVSLSEFFLTDDVFPDFMKKVIGSSEKYGLLNDGFAEVSVFYYEKFLQMQGFLIKLIEPMALIFMGLIMIILIYSTIMPIYDMINQIDML